MKNKLILLLFGFILTLFSGCHFISSFTEEPEVNISLSFDKTKTSVSMGAMDVINLKASQNQNSAEIKWVYDDTVIFAKTDNYSAVITGLKPGTTQISAICGSNSASCIVTVSEDTYAVKVTNPYVYASQDFVNVKPNETVKISAALFGGTVGDIDGFSWTIDKSSIASITTEGNYCWVTGNNDGIAKITLKHNKAAYGYSVLVNCSSDGTNLTYITTTDNVITINLSETNTADFNVDLMNPLISEYASGFTFTVVDSLGNEIPSRPVVVSGAGSLYVSLTAYQVGNCYVRCSHPSALYDLDVLIRVIENAETAYIEPSQTLITVSDTITENISLSLLNYAGQVNPEKFTWSFSDNADSFIDYTIFNGSSFGTGDNINITGKKTGSVKITVGYPGVPSRSIVVLVRNINSEASDATCYITTSQNFIRMHPGDNPEQINISLQNATSDDVKNLKWTITNEAKDGSSSKVINWKTGNGTSVSRNARAVLIDSASAYAIIEPLKEGTAYIDITHPKAIYPTRITVVVSDMKVQEEEKASLNLSSSPCLYIKNGNDADLNVTLSGNGNKEDIFWKSEGTVFVTGNGEECNVKAPPAGSGGSSSKVIASHPNADYPVIFTVITYDTEEQLNDFDIHSIYSYKTDATIFEGQTTEFYLETMGFKDSPLIRWSIIDDDGTVSLSAENQNKQVSVLGMKPGNVLLKASCDGCSDIWFTVKVLSNEIIDTQEDCYLSTSSNVLYFEDINETKNITVDLYNIDEISWSKLKWEVSGTDYQISANGNQCTITSLNVESNAILRISHPLSENELTVYLKTGSRYEYVNEDSCYISTNQDVFELYPGQEEITLVASLNHTEISDSGMAKGFSFSVEDSSIASISFVNYSNTCYVKPIKNGTTKIKITHPDADFEKEVVIIVKQTPDASTIPYITTQTNVITVVQGNYATATVSLMNSSSVKNSSWHWSSKDTRIADVIANNGTSAMISANSPGTIEIKVTHDDCLYALNILVVVIDASVVTNRPYIATSQNIITLQKGSSTTITAEMIGGSAADSNYFRFSASNSSSILVNSVSGSCYVKGLSKGMAYITVYNSRYSDSYSKTVLVIIEDKQEDGVYITTNQNIIKMKPNEKNLTTVTATLVNGQPTDGANFIWWADDYNLVGITPVAEQCSIIPTGRSGTTKIHVKHEKSSKQADILVMISNYETFAFSSTSAQINAEQLYFYPLQIPSVEDSFEVKYSSSNEDVCLVNGSDSVAWVCGRDYGTASLTASMVSKDGTVLATAEMIVTVTVVDPVKPVISLGNSIMTVEVGTSKVFSAVLSGEGVNETEKYNLKWSVKNKSDIISLLNESADKVAYGSDCYIIFERGGEAVLECTHEATGATTELYLIVQEKGEMTINLDKDLETVYKDDGSFTITATLNNATEADYKNIEWSAIKKGGLSIVAVSKTKGRVCTVTPKNVGQTDVLAKLPNGKIARCTVIVKANTEITLDVGAIHVIPGYTEVINYKTNPENASINWYTQMTTANSTLSGELTNYFSIEDDTARKQLRVTGLSDYQGGVAGTISATMMGASSANLPTVKVYVDYNVEVRIEDTNKNILTLLENKCPDTANEKKFNIIYYPIDLDIDIKAGGKNGTLIACVGDTENHAASSISQISIGEVQKTLITEDGIDKMKMTVSVIPHAEWRNDITVVGSLPNDTSGRYSKDKVFTYDAWYADGYDIEVIDLTATGAFTQINKVNGIIDNIVLGDGEEAVFYFKVKNENATPRAGSSSIIQDIETSGNENWVYNGTDKNLMLGNKRPFEETRDSYADYYFGKDKGADVGTSSPTSNVLNLWVDTNSIANTKVYHLAHGWDYYKDLSSDVTGSKWGEYYGRIKDNENFFNELRNAGVDYVLVSREMNVNGKYAFEHPGEQKFSSSWERDVSTKRVPKLFHYRYYHRGWARYRINGQEYGYWFNNGSDGKGDFNSTYNKIKKNFNVKCNPFVIPLSKLESSAFVRPSGYSPIGYRESTGMFGGDWWAQSGYDHSFSLAKVFFPWEYISPTINKDTTPTKLGEAKLLIKYITFKGENKQKEIKVTVQRRMCEAYTNKMWNKNSLGQYVLSDTFIDPNESITVTPYLSLGVNRISGSTSSIKTSDLTVPYEINPKGSTLTITVPHSGGNGKLTLKGVSPYSTTSENTIYKISNHPTTKGDTASGNLVFEVSGAYMKDVTVNASGTGLNQNLKIQFEIDSQDAFVPVLSKKTATLNNSLTSKYSYVDKNARQIVVGDGETLEGFIENLDKSSLTTISNVEFVSLSQHEKLTSATEKDTKGNLQDSLVNVNVVKDNGIYKFTVSHSKDYGYFVYSNKTVDEFYQKVYKLSDMQIDEEACKVWISPNLTEEPPAGTNVQPSLDTVKTAANIKAAKQKKLDETKKAYAAGEGANARTSYTMPYHYENTDYTDVAKSYSVTPVGTLKISYTDTDGENTFQEIIVCVKITDSPCASSSNYGTDVQASYFNSIND